METSYVRGCLFSVLILGALFGLGVFIMSGAGEPDLKGVVITNNFDFPIKVVFEGQGVDGTVPGKSTRDLELRVFARGRIEIKAFRASKPKEVVFEKYYRGDDYQRLKRGGATLHFTIGP